MEADCSLWHRVALKAASHGFQSTLAKIRHSGSVPHPGENNWIGKWSESATLRTILLWLGCVLQSVEAKVGWSAVRQRHKTDCGQCFRNRCIDWCIEVPMRTAGFVSSLAKRFRVGFSTPLGDRCKCPVDVRENKCEGLARQQLTRRHCVLGLPIGSCCLSPLQPLSNWPLECPQPRNRVPSASRKTWLKQTHRIDILDLIHS